MFTDTRSEMISVHQAKNWLILCGLADLNYIIITDHHLFPLPIYHGDISSKVASLQICENTIGYFNTSLFSRR